MALLYDSLPILRAASLSPGRLVGTEREESAMQYAPGSFHVTSERLRARGRPSVRRKS